MILTEKYQGSLLRPIIFPFMIIILLVIMIGIPSCNSNTGQADSSEETVSSEMLKADEGNAGLILPDNFSAFVVADNLGKARHIAVNQNGDLYVMLSQQNNGHSLVALRDTTGDGRADLKKYFGGYSGTGLDIHNGFLYFSSDTSVLRYPLTDGKLVPDGEPEVIIEGFISQSQHGSKSITFDNQGNIYVNVGAPVNACQEQMRTPGSPGQDPCPLLELYGGIWQFKSDQPNQTQQGDGHRYATGIRNAVALQWNPMANLLYAVQHGRDQLHQLYPDLFTEEQSAQLPAEELFLVKDGSDFGWPYCYYDQLQNKKVLAPEYGGDGNKTGRCENVEGPIMAFPGHYAPNDLLFYSGDHFPENYKNGAFIAFHGSWNRAPFEQEGYNVVFVPFEGEKPSGDWKVFADGFAATDTIKTPGDAKYRPTGLALGPDGSLYISDSQKGRIWRVIYNEETKNI